MRIKRQTPKVSRERAIVIASNHNCVSKEVAAKYTDSELKEVLRQLKLNPHFDMNDIIEAAFLSGFEPSSDDLSSEELEQEAQDYLTNYSITQ